MKLDSIIIPAETPAIVAESTQRRLGKYQVLGSWGASISAADFKTSMPRVIDSRPCSPLAPGDGNWGEQDDGSGLRPRAPKMPTSIRLVLDPALAQEGDE